MSDKCSLPSRTELEDVVYRSAQDRTKQTREQFIKGLETWYLKPVMVEGKLVGAVATKGPEIHACILPEGFGRWWNKRTFQEHLQPLLETWGYAMSRANTEAGRHFLRRIGFTEQEGDVWVLNSGLSR
jgi:hypothetical protein